MPSRTAIPDRAIQEVLIRSKRRCPLCFVAGKLEPRDGNIAHIDRDPSNNDNDNLVYLCLQHHHEVDESGSTRIEEIKKARRELYQVMDADPMQGEKRRAPWHVYEDLVVDWVRSAVAKRLGDFFALRKAGLYRGRSGVSHEVDLAVEFSLAGLRYLTVFDIKYRRVKLRAEEVLRFAAVSDDIGASKAVIVCSAGFSPGAVQVARGKGLGLLHVPEGTEQRKAAIFDAAGGWPG